MDVGSVTVATAFIMGLIGFLTTLFLGFDVAKVVSDIVVFAILVVPALGFVWGNPRDIQATSSFIQWYIKTFFNLFPTLILSDLFGSFFGALLHQR